MENLTDAVAHVAPELQMPGGEATVGTQIQCAPGTQGDKVLVHYVAGNFLVFDPYGTCGVVVGGAGCCWECCWTHACLL